MKPLSHSAVMSRLAKATRDLVPPGPMSTIHVQQEAMLEDNLRRCMRVLDAIGLAVAEKEEMSDGG